MKGQPIFRRLQAKERKKRRGEGTKAPDQEEKQREVEMVELVGIELLSRSETDNLLIRGKTQNA
jgi:hypothetical protein